MPDRTLVVSAGHLLVRGFQAVSPDRQTPDGRPVNALFGVAQSLRRALSLKSPDRAVAVIGGREPRPAAGLSPTDLLAITAQRSELAALMDAHGVSWVAVEDEANTVASFVQASIDDGHDVVVLGSDKRFAQLVSDRVWWYDAYKDARYTPEMVAKRFLVPPERVADWLALVGDNDELAGIKGIGKKGATSLLETFGTVERALENIEALDTRSRNALRSAQASISTELSRARLDRHRPLPLSMSELAFQPTALERRNEFYSRLGFFEFLSSDTRETSTVSVCIGRDSIRTAVEVLSKGQAALGVLCEEPSAARGALVGLAACTEDGSRYYFPLGSPSHESNLKHLASWLEDASIQKIGHDTAEAIVALARSGVRLAGIVADTACASHLIEPSNWAPHDLPLVARQVVRTSLPTHDDILGVGQRRKSWSALPPAQAAEYSSAAAAASLAIWKALAPQVDGTLLEEYLALSATVSRMALRGIGVDARELDQIGDDFRAKEQELEADIYRLAGKPLNLASSKQLGTVLFQDLGLTILKRTKTGWSTATEALERIRHEHPIVGKVIDWRALERLRNTWITSLKTCIEADGRVRSTFHPARSFSGRIINSNPDLGRVPGRTEDMQRIRRAFVAAPGTQLLSLDYRQLGLYVLAHLTKDPQLVEPLKRKEDLHRITASAVLDTALQDVSPEQRQLGKVVNFATFAGQGASALSQQLGVSPKEAKEIIERFDLRYRGVRSFQDEQLRLAQTQGYIVTIAGRRWPIGDLESRDPMVRAYAERLARRATHEGSVADVSRRGLLRADQALLAEGLKAAPLLQIHDEVLFEVPENEVQESAEVAGRAMAQAFELEVPLQVGKKVGPNWAELRPLSL